jgi:maleylacetate reductase
LKGGSKHEEETVQLPKTLLSGRFVNLPLDTIYFGPDSLDTLPGLLDEHSVKRAVVVTGRSISNNPYLMDRLHSLLGPRLAGIVGDAQQHVPRSAVLRAAEFARSKRADALISFGGGSPNDTAKAVAWALAEDIETPGGFDRFAIKFEYPDKIEIPHLTKTPVPIFAVPTTLSAGDFTNFIGITDEVRRVKDLYGDRKLTAKAVVLDPKVTTFTPEWLWLSSGIRAVDHCVETILSTMAQPFTDALASHALAMLFRYLKECKKDPADLAARGQCQVASWLSFFGLSNVNLGLSHGVGHQLGARCNVPHGYTSCVMMHNVMEYNREATLARQAWIAHVLGLTGFANEEAAAIAAKEALLGLIRDDLGLPWRLRDVGVAEDAFAPIARDAMQDLIVASNPRKVSSEAEIVELLRSAW